jgi:ribulose-phosphate 3-epimerase
MKIVPAVLAENFDDFVMRMRQAESFTDYVQIDLMDGVFVPSLSFPADKISDITTSLWFEIHLMVKHPSAYMSRIDHPRLKKVIFHFEADVKHLDFIGLMKKRGLKTGMAIRPETGINAFKKIAENVDALLFLTVDPGCYGSPFKPEVMGKIREARQMFKDMSISADGGVSLERLKLFFEAGLDYVCVGSRIFLDGNPKDNYELFVNKIKDLEGG